jgi:enamine deaminase RidA (YjgF/YER057c/UK114 family)
MKREAANPVDWGDQFEMNQGEVIEGARRQLHFSGQIACTPDPDSELGISVVCPGDIRGQTAAALASIDAILEKGGMTRKNLTTLRFFTTEIDGFLENYDVYADWISEAGIRPPQSVIGVARLVRPEYLIEIEATAAD